MRSVKGACRYAGIVVYLCAPIAVVALLLVARPVNFCHPWRLSGQGRAADSRPGGRDGSQVHNDAGRFPVSSQ
jgi:hypothetical protein